MRISNDTFKSTVHRVYNTSTGERISMPFFFGLNFNEVCGVVPTCVSEKRPAKYEPISCGDVSPHLLPVFDEDVAKCRFVVVPTPICTGSQGGESEGTSEEQTRSGSKRACRGCMNLIYRYPLPCSCTSLRIFASSSCRLCFYLATFIPHAE